MRYLKPFMALFMVTLITSCSWWPFGGANTGNCLDDGTCEGANPFEEQLLGGTWYCYGVARQEPWDCSQEEDPSKIVAVTDQSPRTTPASPATGAATATTEVAASEAAQETGQQEKAGTRAELTFEEDEISSESGTSESLALLTNNFLDGFGNDAWAVQLIALESRGEVDRFVADHEMQDPKFVQIESGGAIWYVLLLDIFNDRASADSAAAAWEAEHDPSSRPWVRPVSSLKAAALRAES